MQELRRLTQDKFWEIFHTLLQEDFPQSEIREKENFENLWEKERYLALGWYENEQLTGYAFFISGGEDTLLLDYFAIHASKRGKGSGSLFLEAFRKYFEQEVNYIVLEAENPQFALDEKDQELREKRIAFYEKNNSFFSGVTTTVLDDHYQILVLPTQEEQRADMDWAALMERIYGIIFPQKAYMGKIHIYES